MQKRDKINIKDKNSVDLIFLNTENNSCIPANKIKIKKNVNKYPPLTTKNIDKGKAINEVKILFFNSFVIKFFQSFFLYYKIYLKYY